jgi:hypothetical protein
MISTLMIIFSLILALIAVLIMIVIISIPMYIASKIVARRSTATLGNAVISTIMTAIIIIVVYAGLRLLFFPIPILGTLLAFLITFIILLYVYSQIYRISMERGLLLVIMQVFIWFVLLFITGVFAAMAAAI